MTPQIAPARPEDAPRLTAIARAAYAVYVDAIGFEPPPMRQDFAADIRDGACWACAGGYVVAKPRDGDWLVENVGVAPDAQGAGLGRALLAFAEAEGRARGFRRAVLYTHAKMTRPLALYPRLGWVEVGRRSEGGIDRVYFRKALR